MRYLSGVLAQADAYVFILKLEIGEAVRSEQLDQLAQLFHVERSRSVGASRRLLLRRGLLMTPATTVTTTAAASFVGAATTTAASICASLAADAATTPVAAFAARSFVSRLFLAC